MLTVNLMLVHKHMYKMVGCVDEVLCSGVGVLYPSLIQVSGEHQLLEALLGAASGLQYFPLMLLEPEFK